MSGFTFVAVPLFLLVTGGIAIIYSLVRTFATKETGVRQPGSTLKVLWFNLRAPIGYVYGILALGGTVYLCKIDDASKLASMAMKVSALQTELARRRFAGTDSAVSGATCSIRATVDCGRGTSILDGQLLVYLTGQGLRISGTTGVAISPDGPFADSVVPARAGVQRFLRLRSGAVWGLDVLSSVMPAEIELFLAGTDTAMKASE